MMPPFFTLRVCDETESTNEDVKREAAAGAPEGLVIQSRIQTAGKGRQGRVWSSPAGNVYASMLLRPRCHPQEAGLYTFVTALAISDAVADLLPQAEIKLKWPNDVLVGGKKICGILLEAGPLQGQDVPWLVIGTGINVATHPDQALYPTTSLKEEGANKTADEVLALYLQHFAKWQNVYKTKGFAPLRERWLDRAQKGGMIARLPALEIAGEFETLDENGFLVLRLTDGSVRTIAAADVFFVER